MGDTHVVTKGLSERVTFGRTVAGGEGAPSRQRQAAGEDSVREEASGWRASGGGGRRKGRPSLAVGGPEWGGQVTQGPRTAGLGQLGPELRQQRWQQVCGLSTHCEDAVRQKGKTTAAGRAEPPSAKIYGGKREENHVALEMLP